MDIDGPFYLKEFIYENQIFKEFISLKNNNILLDVIYNYFKNNKLLMNETTNRKIIDIISYFGKELINNYSNRENIKIKNIKLVTLNKELLKDIILFLKTYNGNLDVFEIYVDELKQKKRLTDHEEFEKTLSKDNKPNNIFTFKNKNNNEFIDNKEQTIKSLQNQINHLVNKYPSKNRLMDEIIIQSIEDPESKYIINKTGDINEFVDNNEELDSVVKTLTELKSTLKNNIIKDKIDDILNYMSSP